MADTDTRTDLLNRLKRAEGQLRGIQRMIENDDPCGQIAAQMSAVRKALDSAYTRMTVCHIQSELVQQLNLDDDEKGRLTDLMSEMQSLLGKS